MAAEEKITSYIDLKSTGKETKELLSQINQVYDAFNKTKNTKVTISGTDNMKGVAEGVKKVKQEQDELQRITERLIKSYEKRQALDSENAKNLALENARLKERAALLAADVKVMNASANSIDFARAKVGQLTKERNKLDLASKDGVARQKELNAEIDKYNAFIKDNVDEYQKQKINIGNYSGALKILEGTLDEVRKKLNETKKAQQGFTISTPAAGPGRPSSGSGVRPGSVGDPQAVKLYNDQIKQTADEVARLNKEEALLSRIVESQINGFASATAEVKSNEKALQALAAAGLANTEFYDKLLKETAELKDSVGDLKNEIKNLASDTSTLDGLIAGAQLLAGAYGFAVATAELFGKENEEVAKAMKKLQAVQTILVSLQGIQNALQKDSSLQLLIYNTRLKIQTFQTTLASAAESKFVAVRWAAVAAQKALNFVMNTAGGPILAVVAAVGILALAIYKLTQNTDDSVETFQRLNNELDNSKKLLNERIDIIKNNSDEELARLRAQFSTEAALRKEGIKGLKEQFQATFEVERDRRAEYEKSRKFIEDTFKNTDIDDLTEDQKEALKLADQFVKSFEGIAQQRTNLATAIRIAESDNARATTEELVEQNRKQIENSKIGLQTRLSVLNDTVSNERKTYEERIKAAREAQRIQEQLIEKEAAQRRLDPNLKNDPAELANIEKTRSNAIINSRRETNKKIDDLTREQLQRQRQAAYEIARTELETTAATAQKTASDANKSLEERLTAQYDYYKAQKALIEGAKNLALENDTLTAEERKAIEAQANADVLQLRKDFLDAAKQIALDELDQENAEIIGRQQIRLNNEIEALNKRLAAGLITRQQYQKELLEIETRGTKESLQLQIDNIQKVIDARKAAGLDTINEEVELSELQKRLSDEVTAKKLENLERLKEKERELRDAIAEFAITLISGTFERQKNEIQERIDKIDEEEEAQKEKVKSEVLTEDEKEAKLLAIETASAAKRKELENQARQVDERKARFDRVVSIAKIAQSTAEAIIKSVAEFPLTGGQPFASIAAAIGAVQIATILAQPLPKYKHGRTGGRAEFAITGDGGRPEVLASPDGSQAYVTPSTDTLTYIPKDWSVYPDVGSFLDTMHGRNFPTLQGMPVSEGADIERVSMMMAHQIGRVEKAIANKQERHMVFSKGQLMEIVRDCVTEILIINPNGR